MLPHDFMGWLLVGLLVTWAVVVAYSIADAVRAERSEQIKTNHGRSIDLARSRDERLP